MGLSTQLERLDEADLIRRSPDRTELAYLFRHALGHDAAYNSLVRSDRRALHRTIGHVLEALYPEQGDALAPRLAQHYIEGEEWPGAAQFAMRAGENALGRYAQREAGDHFQHALDALAHVPEADPALIFDAWLGWVRASFKYKPFPTVLQALEQAEQIARRLDDPRRLVMALNWIARVHIASGHGTRGIPMAVEAYTLAKSLDDERLIIIPGYVSAHVRIGLDPRATVTQLDETIVLAHKYHDAEMEAYALGAKGLAHARLGEVAESRAAIERAMKIVRALDSPLVESDIDIFAGWSYLDSLDARQAVEYGQRGIDLALATDNMDCVCYGFACVGFGNLQTGNLPAALGAFDEAVRRATASGAKPVEAIGQAGLAVARYFAGYAGDLSEIRHALAQARAADDPFITAQLSQVIGEVLFQSGENAEAKTYLENALDYYSANGMQPYQERVLAPLARLIGAEQAQTRDN